MHHRVIFSTLRDARFGARTRRDDRRNERPPLAALAENRRSWLATVVVFEGCFTLVKLFYDGPISQPFGLVETIIDHTSATGAILFAAHWLYSVHEAKWALVAAIAALLTVFIALKVGEAKLEIFEIRQAMILKGQCIPHSTLRDPIGYYCPGDPIGKGLIDPLATPDAP